MFSICPPHGSRSLESPGREIPQTRFTILLTSLWHICSLVFRDFRHYLYNMTRNMYILYVVDIDFIEILYSLVLQTFTTCSFRALDLLPVRNSVGMFISFICSATCPAWKNSKGLNVSKLYTSYIKTYESRMTSILADLYIYIYIAYYQQAV